MKRRTVYLLLALFLLVSAFACACSPTDSISGNNPPADSSLQTDGTTYESMIRELEDKILELQQNQYISEAEYQKEIKKLQAQLAELKNSVPSSSDSSSTDSGSAEQTEGSDTATTEKPSVSQFLYKKEGTTAIITGYTGSDSHIVIPSVIDGYQVTAIGDSAFTSKKIKSVIISNGIKKIDWFAFNECTALVSVTIPQSVTSIGYSAFAPQSNTFTIYCHNDSFAHKYAKSYGWSYSLI
ncbi:MAG: leucine-rich repeat protein [Clostridia bacterium]|nr:leucine-rich repeat protein [Clostridia bacterium]